MSAGEEEAASTENAITDPHDGMGSFIDFLLHGFSDEK